jgi:antitoxin YefM
MESYKTILIAKEDWQGIQEPLYLQAIPGFVESIRATENADDWRAEEAFLRALDSLES